MGSAELGREAGEAGGPLLTGAVAALTGLAAGFLALAAVVALTTTSAADSRALPMSPRFPRRIDRPLPGPSGL